MFRGVHYVTVDYMVYVQDGWITFSYWKPQFVKESTKEIPNDSNLKNSSIISNFRIISFDFTRK